MKIRGVKGNHFVKNYDGNIYIGSVWPNDSVFSDFLIKNLENGGNKCLKNLYLIIRLMIYRTI